MVVSRLGASRALALTLALGMSSRLAHGQTKDECVDAFEEGQSLRNALRLRAARERYTVCLRYECPARVRADCAQHLEQLDRDLPTVVVGARDRDGRDLPAARVSIDGNAIVASASGAGTAVDPGLHTFRFEHDGRVPLEQQVLVRMGEHNRAIVVTLEEIAANAPAPSAPPPAPVHESGAPSTRTAGYLLTGGGVAALAVGAGFGVSVAASCGGLFHSPCESLHDAPIAQRDSERRSLATQGWIANIGVVLGVALIGAGIYFLTRPAPTAASTRQVPPRIASPGLANGHVRF